MIAEQIASIDGETVGEALKLIASGGIGAAITGGIINLTFQSKLEKLKSQLEKKNTIHKLQFEKEFELYGELWKALLKVRNTINITPILDSIPEGKDFEEVYKERWELAANNFDKANGILNENLPFYHKDVSDVAKLLLDECRQHLISLKGILIYPKRKSNCNDKDDKLDMFDKAEEVIKKVIEAIDEIEKAIQKRIGLLQEAELRD